MKANHSRKSARLTARRPVVFGWRAGGVLVIDNMLRAHARAAFDGPRRILAGIAESMEGKHLMNWGESRNDGSRGN